MSPSASAQFQSFKGYISFAVLCLLRDCGRPVPRGSAALGRARARTLAEIDALGPSIWCVTAP